MNTSLENLPEITFAEKDDSVIVSEMVADFEEKTGRKLYPGDPLRLLLLTFAEYIVLQRNKIDFSAKQNLLKYAQEGYLENLAALLEVTRLEPTAAVTTLEFSISEPQSQVITIPRGTRATTGNKVYFATVENVEIPIGETACQVLARCTETGEVGNDFYPGQINVLSDPFPFHSGVVNVTVSQGGANIEALDSLRERTRTAPESFSSAGPEGAYIFWAKTASQLISDVSVSSPSPGVVEIVPLLEGGEIPTDDILNAVYEECSNDERRPLTDFVRVVAPEKISYDIDVQYFISRANSAVGLNIQNQVQQAVAQYQLWQKSELGRDLNPSKLIEMIMAAGAKRVMVAEPEFKVLEFNQIAVSGEVRVTYGGLEDD